MTDINKLDWSACKWKLGLLWLCAGGIVFLFMVVMAMGPKFDSIAAGPDGAAVTTSHAQEAWGWFLTTLMPSLSLIVGVLVSDAGAAAAGTANKTVDIKYYRLAYGLSAFYLGLVVLTLLATSFPVGDAHAGIEMLRMSNSWLGPIQGLASAALGIFYLRANSDAKPDPEADAPPPAGANLGAGA